jgi:hypothetical protein
MSGAYEVSTSEVLGDGTNRFFSSEIPSRTEAASNAGAGNIIEQQFRY